MRITERYKRCLLLMPCILLPYLLFAQELDTAALKELGGHATIYVDSTSEDSEYEDDISNGDTTGYAEKEVRTHYLWDQAVPVNIDSTEEWWINDGLVQRNVPVTVLNKLRADKDLQYDRKENKENRNEWFFLALLAFARFLQSIRLLIFVLLIGGLLFLIIYFMRQQGFRFSKKATDADLTGAEETDPGTAGYEKQVQEAIARGQFRQAVRFLHLQTLRLLAEQQLITLSKDKTNADYLRLLFKTQWYQPFARLTRDYEYIWYGDITVNAAQFDRIHGQFRKFINELGYIR